jgi:hypothetical protein
MRTTTLLALALAAGFGIGGQGCVSAPEGNRAWVAYHASIEPSGQAGEWDAEELKFIRESIAVPATKFDLKKKKEYALPDLIGWKDTTDYCLAWYGSDLLQIKAYYLNARRRRWTTPTPEEKRGPIIVDFVYQKPPPITDAELRRCESRWQAVFGPLKTRFGDRLNTRPDAVPRPG